MQGLELANIVAFLLYSTYFLRGLWWFDVIMSTFSLAFLHPFNCILKTNLKFRRFSNCPKN